MALAQCYRRTSLRTTRPCNSTRIWIFQFTFSFQCDAKSKLSLTSSACGQVGRQSALRWPPCEDKLWQPRLKLLTSSSCTIVIVIFIIIIVFVVIIITIIMGLAFNLLWQLMETIGQDAARQLWYLRTCLQWPACKAGIIFYVCIDCNTGIFFMSALIAIQKEFSMSALIAIQESYCTFALIAIQESPISDYRSWNDQMWLVKLEFLGESGSSDLWGGWKWGLWHQSLSALYFQCNFSLPSLFKWLLALIWSC